MYFPQCNTAYQTTPSSSPRDLCTLGSKKFSLVLSFGFLQMFHIFKCPTVMTYYNIQDTDILWINQKDTSYVQLSNMPSVKRRRTKSESQTKHISFIMAIRWTSFCSLKIELSHQWASTDLFLKVLDKS